MFSQNYELILGEQKFDVIKRNSGQYVPFKVRQMGIYLVIEASNGLVLVWDKKTTIFIKLDPKFQVNLFVIYKCKHNILEKFKCFYWYYDYGNFYAN